MPGKQARVLCPVCQEPIPPDETECGNCGAFVIDEAVVRLSRALGLDREPLRERATKPVVAAAPKAPVPAPKVPAPEGTLAKVDDFLRESEKLPPETRVKRVSPERPAVTSPAPPRMSTSPSAVRRETPGIKRPAAVKPSAPPVPKPISASPKVPASSTLQPIPVTRP